MFMIQFTVQTDDVGIRSLHVRYGMGETVFIRFI